MERVFYFPTTPSFGIAKPLSENETVEGCFEYFKKPAVYEKVPMTVYTNKKKDKIAFFTYNRYGKVITACSSTCSSPGREGYEFYLNENVIGKIGRNCLYRMIFNGDHKDDHQKSEEKSNLGMLERLFSRDKRENSQQRFLQNCDNNIRVFHVARPDEVEQVIVVWGSEFKKNAGEDSTQVYGFEIKN